jgi:prepilin-type N-terminal cleavage/methylation domain-containing protein
MIMNSKTRNTRYKSAPGFTLIELVIAMTINLILILAVGIVFVSGNNAWQRTFDSAHNKAEEDAQAITIAFGNIGRKANRINYYLYTKNGNNYRQAKSSNPSTEQIVYGDAVEFRYWDVGFDQTDSHSLLDSTKTATAYAFFYLDGRQLKIDYGPYPPGAVPENGGRKNTTDITTVVLTENVSIDDIDDHGIFSHTTLNQTGHGSVRLNITLSDPEDDKTVQVITSTLMRNIWPR